MKKFFLVNLIVIFSIFLFACSENTTNQAKKEPSTEKSSKHISTTHDEKVNSSCQNAPMTFEFYGKKYRLIQKNTTLEPGMKFGYLKCENGNLKPGDAQDSIIIYSEGAKIINEVIVIGKWGRMLYSSTNEGHK